MGTSRGLYFKRFLAPVRLNDDDIDWGAQDLGYLEKERCGPFTGGKGGRSEGDTFQGTVKAFVCKLV